MSDARKRTTRQKLALFKRFFTGREDVYGTYDPQTGKVRQVKQPVTDRVLLRHLRGKQPYGLYLLREDRTGALAVDFDEPDLLGPINLVHAAGNYDLPAYIERSKSKGHHVWLFFEDDGVPTGKARMVARHILGEIGCPGTEIFPKHDRLAPSARYGNFINAPLFGRLVPRDRTVFLQPEDYAAPCEDQWELLESIERIEEGQLEEIVEINEISPPEPPPKNAGGSSDPNRTYGLPPCARRMLREGVPEYQRVSCFRLAVHLKKAGLPLDTAVAALRCWAQKNTPRNGKRIITDREIHSQAGWAYEKDYRGCGCEDEHIRRYCDSSSRLHTPSKRSAARSD